MLYAALGDSITYGYCSSHDSKRFVNRLQRQLRTANRVNLMMTAKPGWTSKQLLKAVRKVSPGIWDEVRVVTLIVGGNDAMRAAPWLMSGNRRRLLSIADDLNKNLADIIRTVRRKHTIFLIGTLYNPFPNSSVATECTDVLNRTIRKVARQQRIRVVDLERAFAGREAKLIDSYRRGVIKDFRFIRSNPVHPNDVGHLVIMRSFLRGYRLARQARSKAGGSRQARTKKI